MAVVHTLVDVLAASGDLIACVAPAAHTHTLGVILNTLLASGARLGGTTPRGLHCTAAFACWVALKAGGTLAGEGAGLIATHSSCATRVVGTLVDVRAPVATKWVAVEALGADTLGLSVDELAVGVRATANVLAWIYKTQDTISLLYKMPSGRDYNR